MTTTRSTPQSTQGMTREMTREMTQTEALREDLELTRQHLADTVQELSRQLNVPRRVKESATDAGHRAVQAAGQAGQRAKEAAGGAGHRALEATFGAREKARQVPDLGRRHPGATLAVGGAVALGVGFAAWIAGRRR